MVNQATMFIHKPKNLIIYHANQTAYEDKYAKAYIDAFHKEHH